MDGVIKSRGFGFRSGVEKWVEYHELNAKSNKPFLHLMPNFCQKGNKNGKKKIYMKKSLIGVAFRLSHWEILLNSQKSQRMLFPKNQASQIAGEIFYRYGF